MNKLINQFKSNSNLLSSIQNCEKEITTILQGFITNFPEYTDHSINHSKTVIGYAEHLLDTEIEKLNEDEAYILLMAGFLHDIGMCPTNDMKKNICESSDFKNSGKQFEDYLRDIHHKLSYLYITKFWKELKIVNETYAEAIGLVGMGHRKVDLLDFDIYNPEFVVKSGSDFVCLPYLASVLRLADECDITNDRTPELLYNQYFPSNKVSKEEWEKHKANYFVTFHKPTIKITSKCFEKNLYYALLKQYSKIDSVIKYAQKVVNTIPLNERKLKLDYLKLEKDIKTIGFVPKDIGFSFDLQNTINTFIGDNIYDNKFVALRECLQNAIDTCRYKKQITKSGYTPNIRIQLNEAKLTISDNGLGMDEFIIENYFSKLAKSYYKENKVSKEFEAISQFGIGVFSYFLISEYFDVETKQDEKPALKFRVTKDADSYFYFYAKTTQTTSGTTISFNLLNELPFDELLDQLKHYIRFVEFPIDVIYEGRHEILVPNDFTIDKSEMLSKHVEREYRDVLQKLVTINANIENNECEGVLGLLISLDADGTYVPIHNYDTLKTYRTGIIELSQKGIYVGEDHEGRLNNVIGKINLKQKNDIDLGRYHIKSPQKILGIYEIFYNAIFKKLFDSWQAKSPEAKRELSRGLIGYYFEHHSHFSLEFIEQYFDYLYFKVYDGEKIIYLNITDIIKIDEFIIVRDSTPFWRQDKSNLNIEELFALFSKTLIIEPWAPPASFLLDIFKARKSNITVKCTLKHWYFSIKPKQDGEIDQYEILLPRFDFYKFDLPHICAYTNLWVESPFNSNHDIIQYFILHKERINKNQQMFKYFTEFFTDTARFISNLHSSSSELKNPTSEIVHLNSLLSKINGIAGTHFILSQKDFSGWVNENINWDSITA